MFSVNVMAEVEAKKSNSGKGASMNESESLTLAMSAENKLSSMTKSTEQKDMYWFAHAADPPQEKPRRGLGSQSPDSPDLENETLSHSPPQQRVESPSKQHDIKSPSEPQIPRTLADIYWFAQGGEALTPSADLASDSGFSDGKEALCPLTQKEREEKARYIREKQAEERLRRFNEIKQQQMNAQHNREQQEEERRRKIEEYRQRDQERRNAVEERKRQIWEAEQERREALLRRNLDRESKLEARRYAQRSSTSFVFGSSTPRTLDLDVGILGGRSSSILFAASGGRRSEERDVDGSKKRAISACSLDRRPEGNDDCMDENGGFEPCVKLREPNIDSSALQDRTFKRRSYGGLASEEIKACLTMTDGNTTFLASPDAGSGDPFLDLHSSGWLIGSGVIVGEDAMTRSLICMSSRGRRKTDLTPSVPSSWDRSSRTQSPGIQTTRAVSTSRLDLLAQPRRRYTGSVQQGTGQVQAASMSKSMLNLANSVPFSRQSKKPQCPPRAKEKSRSMVHLAGPAINPHSTKSSTTLFSGSHPQAPSISAPRGPKSYLSQSLLHLAVNPRPTRTSRLRKEVLSASSRSGQSSSVTVPRSTEALNLRRSSFEAIRKDPSSRPQSSLSQASDVSPSSSQASANLRPRTCSRRPRPISIAGSTPDKAILESTANHRQARSVDKKVVAQASRMSRAKPTSPEVSKEVAKPPTTHKPAVKQRPAALNQKPKIPTSAEPAAPSGLSTERISIVTEPPAPIDIAAASIETSSAKTIPLCDSNKSDEHINKLETMKDIQETPPEPAVTPEIATKTDLEPEISLKSDLKVEMLMDADIEHEIPTEVSHKPGIPVETVPKPEIQTQLPLNEVESRQKIESFKDEPLVKSPLKSETPLKPSPGVVLTPTGTPTGKPRITSEEEAKAALAEKRRLAREQAEREAELERQRQEELRRKEEERLRLEEEEQRKQEEEQIRLAEEHRRQEEEKLQRAIEEQKKREEEEQKRFEEESRMKAEKEEQERRAREETEKQRKELEEKLKKEEAERAERKKRVEQIMSRTRARGTAQLTGKTDVAESSKTPSPENEQRQSLDEKKSPEPSDGREVKQKTLCFSNIDQKAEGDDKDPVTVVSAVSETKNLLVDTSNNKSVDLLANVDSSIVTNNDLIFPVIDQQWNKELSLKSVSNNSHTNGFHTNSQNDGLINGTGNLKKEEPLLDLDTTITSSGHHSEFEQLIDISNTSPAQHHVHSLLSNVDQLNSNRVTPIIAFEEVTRKQEALMPDLLS
ncbi:uncharacterized protein LOC143250436 isoform X3 [Tachypleus tridentatus]|uniref:uncharacterized protein LOC143250436 isoform X3 n=1 Tax=Tachypleus tridentatus TaxID=6853 RepID=UPI003FD27392